MRTIPALVGAVLLLVAAEGPEEAKPTEPAKPPKAVASGGTIFSPAFLNYCNKNKDGTVTRPEFLDCFVDFFNLVDENKDGAITKPEYDAAYKKAREAQEKRWTDHFEKLDKDKDGKCTESEWPDPKFKEVDSDRDGTVSVKEFLAVKMKGFYVIFLPGGFQVSDENRDGKVSLDEQKKRVLITFKEFDENGDGVISAIDAILQGQKQKKEKEKSSESKGKQSEQSAETPESVPPKG